MDAHEDEDLRKSCTSTWSDFLIRVSDLDLDLRLGDLERVRVMDLTRVREVGGEA